jgi:hypothetical protein
MNDFLPLIISVSAVAGFVALRAGYVAHHNLNDPEQHYQDGSTYLDNTIFTGFFSGVPKGGGNKTRHRKHKRGKNTRRK